MPPYKLFSTARSYSLSMIKKVFTPHGNILPIQFHTRISNFMFQKSTLTLIFLRFTFIHIQVVLYFLFFYSQAYQIQHFFTNKHCANNTRPSHYHISHYKFYLTFRDYCGINLLLRHQYGSHYLYLNFKNPTERIT